MSRTIDIFPVNRVEGDLEIRVELEDNVITEARSVGTLYRGFENILVGRSPLNGLVITPRICGICCTAHLMAAAKALDMLYDVSIPDTARRIRNIALGVEKLQSDMRHCFLIFMCDFANPLYKKHSLFHEAVARYEPLKGDLQTGWQILILRWASGRPGHGQTTAILRTVAGQTSLNNVKISGEKA